MHGVAPIIDTNKKVDMSLLKRVLHYIKPYKFWVIISILLITTLTVVELSVPYITKTAIDNYIVSDTTVLTFADKQAFDDFIKNHDYTEFKTHENTDSYAILLKSKQRGALSKKEISKYTQNGQLSDKNVFIINNKPEYIKLLTPDTFIVLDNNNLAVYSQDFRAISDNIPPTIKNEIWQESIKGLKKCGVLYLFTIIIRFILLYAQIYIITYFSQHAMYDLRSDVFSHLQRMPLSFFDKNPVGRLVTRSTNDIRAIDQLLSNGLVTFIQDVFTIIGIIIMMVMLNWRLALVSYTVLPFLIFSIVIFNKKSRVIYREVRTRLSKINTRIAEDISGMKIIQLFNIQARKRADFSKTNTDYYNTTMRQMHLFAFFRPLISNTSHVVVAIVLWYGGGQIMRNVLSLGMLLAFLNYLERFFQPINSLSEKFNILQAALAGAERVFALLDEKPENYRQELTSSVKLRGELEFDKLWMAYEEENWILKDVSLKIKAGEKIAIVGHTGSGKTTIVNLLMDMYPFQKGAIKLDGKNLGDYSLADIRKNIGMVQQDVFLFSGTIRENISLESTGMSDADVKKAAQDVNVDTFINSLGDKYDEEVMERGATFSVGQRQLLAFARVLAYDPAIFILDEATSNIDTETEIHIQKALEKVMENRTSIIIAHRLSTIQHVDRIIVLHKGKIAEIGAHQELLAAGGLYYDLYRLQYESPQMKAKA